MQYRKSSYAEGVFDTYWFEKNLQGDIVAVYDAEGIKLASYTYDAWGNCTITYHNGGTSTTATYNPFRYRGYYFDTETGFYYLNSRYYDPAIGRFINADAVELLGANGDFASYSLYSYCGNNPVSHADANGHFWNIVIGAAIGAVVNVATTYIAAKVTGQDYTLTDAAHAALAGAVNAIPVVGPALNGVISGGYAAYTSYKNGATTKEATISGLVTGVCAMGSVTNLAGWANQAGSGLSLMASGFVDLVFGTGSNSIAAATTKCIIDTAKTRKKTVGGSRKVGSIVNAQIY